MDLSEGLHPLLHACFVVLLPWKLDRGSGCSIILFYYLVGTCIVWASKVGRMKILPISEYADYGIIPSVNSGTTEITAGNNHWTHYKDLS